MVISSSSVPSRGFLYPGEFVLPKAAVEKMLDKASEGGVDYEVASETDTGEEGV